MMEIVSYLQAQKMNRLPPPIGDATDGGLGDRPVMQRRNGRDGRGRTPDADGRATAGNETN